MQRESGHLIRAILRTVQTCNTGAAPSYQRCLTSCSNLYTRGLSSSCTTNACGTILLTRQQSTPLIQTSWHELQCRGFAAQTAARSHSRAHQAEQHRSQLAAPSGTQGLYLMAFTVAMIGVTYASVPLYRMFCQATGYGGTVQQGSTVEDKLKAREETYNADLEAAAAARDVTVHFNADVSDSLQWKFYPTQRSVQIKPGESTLAFYTAQNNSDRSITGVSTYNVTPQQAGVYFNKIQCFCFEEQKLRPGEKIDMPVFFYVDPEFATDPKLKSVNHLTLSYTFFKINEEDEEDIEEAA